MLGDEHPQAAEIRQVLAEIREAMGEHRRAVEQLREILDLLDCHPDNVRYEQASICLSLAEARANAGAFDEAVALAGVPYSYPISLAPIQLCMVKHCYSMCALTRNAVQSAKRSL